MLIESPSLKFKLDIAFSALIAIVVLLLIASVFYLGTTKALAQEVVCYGEYGTRYELGELQNIEDIYTFEQSTVVLYDNQQIQIIEEPIQCN
tara:strand:+ start:19968 stop:20243 length:276 start_codon:yes stop_codon:yes gene_type:complete